VHFSFPPCLLHVLPISSSLIWSFNEECKLWSTSMGNFLQPPVISSFEGPNIFLCTLLSNTLNLCSYHDMRDQISHPHKTTGKI
jgi:hypothetical protein